VTQPRNASETKCNAWEFTGVQKRCGGFHLLIDQLCVAPAQRLAVIGPAGAGKSTLLQLAAGLMQADAGKLLLNNTDISNVCLNLSQQRRVTLVDQRPVMLSGSVRFNIEYGLRLRGDIDAGRKAAAMLDRLKLAPLGNQRADSLSGGETQLVAIARALVLEPAFLLLDEPTAHLDPGRVQLVEQVVAELSATLGCTYMWATHNLFQARRVATHAALLLGGRLIETAAVDKFFDSPAEQQTADFIEGRMVY